MSLTVFVVSNIVIIACFYKYYYWYYFSNLLLSWFMRVSCHLLGNRRVGFLLPCHWYFFQNHHLLCWVPSSCRHGTTKLLIYFRCKENIMHIMCVIVCFNACLCEWHLCLVKVAYDSTGITIKFWLCRGIEKTAGLQAGQGDCEC